MLAALLPAAVAAVVSAADSPAWTTFTDVAGHAGLTASSVYGGLTKKRFIIETNGAGVAWIDADDDGWLDAFILNGTRLEEGTRRPVSWPAGEEPTARLYRNRRDGTFTDVTAGSGLARVAFSSSVCAGDYDNDGRIDLFTTAWGTNALYRNVSSPAGIRFEDRTTKAGFPTTGTRWGSGCSFIDYDRDGRLDLFVSNYLLFDLATASEPGQGINCVWKGIPVNCGPKGLPTDTNLLFHQEADGRFTDVSAKSGIASVRNRYPMTAAAADLDDDRWVDLYVASDSTAAILYRNNRDGTFTDVALESGTAFSENGMPQAGMGLAVSDVNRDGRLELLKTHFADDVPALYRNLGGGFFEDAATATGVAVENRFVEWGAGMPDLDNDGWPDLMYVTGNVYPEIEARLPRYVHKGPRVIFRNRAGGRYENVSASSGSGATTPHSSRGAAFGDFDNDGDVDVLVMNMNEPPSLLRNDYTGPNHWLKVRLEGRTSNRLALGATVLMTADGRTTAQAVLSQASYYSHDDIRLHFGLGPATDARIEVRWPSGKTSILERAGAGQTHQIQEP